MRRTRLAARDVLPLAPRSQAEAESAVESRHLLHGPFRIGFRVADLDVARERLSALDVPLRGIVHTEPDGSTRSLQLEDPDGNVLQLFELLEKR